MGFITSPFFLHNTRDWQKVTISLKVWHSHTAPSTGVKVALADLNPLDIGESEVGWTPQKNI